MAARDLVAAIGVLTGIMPLPGLAKTTIWPCQIALECSAPLPCQDSGRSGDLIFTGDQDHVEGQLMLGSLMLVGTGGWTAAGLQMDLIGSPGPALFTLGRSGTLRLTVHTLGKPGVQVLLGQCEVPQ